ncbi:MAG TPA: hypothetical protein VIS96_12140 [Terrimicrobiaceae bacterium]
MNIENSGDSGFLRVRGEVFPIERVGFHDLNADEDELWLQHPVAQEIHLEHLLCDPSVLVIDEGARFFLCWEQIHPEAIPIHEFAGVSRSEWHGNRINGRERLSIVNDYNLEHERLAPILREKEIKRQEAWELLALNWVPLTFFAEAGISKFIPDHE